MSQQRPLFWNQKFLAWDFKNYHLLRWIGLTAVRNRQEFAKSRLRGCVSGKSVLELGCGSGRMIPSVLQAGAVNYTGIDFSDVALHKARTDCTRDGFDSERVSFLCCDAIADAKFESFDVIFSLGLLDWLTEPEVVRLGLMSSGKIFFHSFSESRPQSLIQMAHRFYARFDYGASPGRYTPAYRNADELAKYFAPGEGVRVERPRGMNFCSFIHNLPERT